MSNARKRNWAFIVYPESAPDNWRDILTEQLVPGFISPLHEDDIDPNGEPKKPHWHVLLLFRGLKSPDQVKEITDLLNATVPQPCKDIRAYARYLCHLDNPEKAQYSPADVINLSGADYLEMIKSAADTDTALGEMMDWLDDQGIYSFAALSRFARSERPDWFRVITSSRSYFLSQYCKSKQWEAENENPAHYYRTHHTPRDND